MVVVSVLGAVVEAEKQSAPHPPSWQVWVAPVPAPSHHSGAASSLGVMLQDHSH